MSENNLSRYIVWLLGKMDKMGKRHTPLHTQLRSRDLLLLGRRSSLCILRLLLLLFLYFQIDTC